MRPRHLEIQAGHSLVPHHREQAIGWTIIVFCPANSHYPLVSHLDIGALYTLVFHRRSRLCKIDPCEISSRFKLVNRSRVTFPAGSGPSTTVSGKQMGKIRPGFTISTSTFSLTARIKSSWFSKHLPPRRSPPCAVVRS